MDLERLSQLAATANPPQLKKKTKKNTARNTSFIESGIKFGNLMQQAADRNAMLAELPGLRNVGLNGTETVEELLEEVMQSGEELKNNMLMEPLRKYKKTVGRFMRHILDNSVKLEYQDGIRNIKNMTQKKFSILKVVDKKLEELATCILKNQADHLEILGKIDEINGMLVDLAC